VEGVAAEARIEDLDREGEHIHEETERGLHDIYRRHEGNVSPGVGGAHVLPRHDLERNILSNSSDSWISINIDSCISVNSGFNSYVRDGVSVDIDE
jgi:hypothetical protein